jgi:hypothetical protein
MNFLAEELSKAGFKRGLVIALPDFDEISALDEATLNKHGWFHVDALAKLIQKKKEIESGDTHQDVPGA